MPTPRPARSAGRGVDQSGPADLLELDECHLGLLMASTTCVLRRACLSWHGFGVRWVPTTAVALVVWPIAYELRPPELVVRFGLMRTRIAYGEINAVAPSRSVVTAPSYATDRLAIHQRARSTPALVSPADRERFLVDIDNERARPSRPGPCHR